MTSTVPHSPQLNLSLGPVLLRSSLFICLVEVLGRFQLGALILIKPEIEAFSRMRPGKRKEVLRTTAKETDLEPLVIWVWSMS